jgi:hypothetical protein
MSIVKLQTPVFRVAFPNVFVAVAPPGSEKKKYSVTMLFTLAEIAKDAIEKKKWADMKAAAEFCAKDMWPKGMPKNLQNPFKDGMEKQEYDGYGAGVVFVNASTSSGRASWTETSRRSWTRPTSTVGATLARP